MKAVGGRTNERHARSLMLLARGHLTDSFLVLALVTYRVCIFRLTSLFNSYVITRLWYLTFYFPIIGEIKRRKKETVQLDSLLRNIYHSSIVLIYRSVNRNHPTDSN